MALRRALPRWDRHGQSTSSQEILASLKALLLCDYDVSQFCDGYAVPRTRESKRELRSPKWVRI